MNKGCGSMPCGTAVKPLTALDGADIAARNVISYRIALFVDGALRQYPAQLGLASAGGLAVLFAGTAFDFLFHYGNTRAIHLHIQNWNAWPQLELLTNFDFLSDGFGGALHVFGGRRQTCQQLHLPAALIEQNLMTDYSSVR